MNTVIPAEAVEAAAKALIPTAQALQPVFAEAGMAATIDLDHVARKVLEAAAPYMLSAWINDTSRLPKDQPGYGPDGTYRLNNEGGEMNITEFLEGRIAEDEAAAQAAYYEGQRWYSEEEFVGRYPDCCDCGCEVMMGANRKAEAAHIAEWQPSRVLAECAAKRAIIAGIIPERDPQSGHPDYDPLWIIRELAAVYKDHPDYQQEWAV